MFEINETFTIFTHGIEQLEDHLAKLNRKAEKIGFGGYELAVGDSEIIEIKVYNEDTNKYRTEMASVTEITVVGEYPTYDGWSLVATNEHDAESGMNILRTFPWAHDVQVPNRYRSTAAQLCEECGNNRERKQTFIVTRQDGEFKQVGSTCLKSFVGSASTRSLVSMLEAVETIYEMADEFSKAENYFSTGGARMFDIDTVLAVTAAAIEAYGWMSKGNAYRYDKVPTSSYVQTYLMQKDLSLRDPNLKPSDTHKATAKAVDTWLVELASQDDLDDYLWNLSALGARDAVTMRHFGLLCSAVATHNRIQQQQVERAARVNDYFGEVGGKYGNFSKSTKGVVGGPVVMKVAFTGQPRPGYAYNAPPTYPNILRDEDGRTFVWYTARDLQSEFGTDTSLEVSFTVKQHSVYSGTKQTVVTRAKVTELDDQELAF